MHILVPLLSAVSDGNRQLDGKRGSVPLTGTLRSHLATVQLDEVAHQRQSEAEPRVRARAGGDRLMKALEEMGQVFLADALPGVTDHDFDVRMGPQKMYLNSPTLRREFHGVDQKVPNHLLQPVGVAGHSDGPGIQHTLQSYLLRVGGRPYRIDGGLDDRLEIDRAHVETHLPGDDP